MFLVVLARICQLHQCILWENCEDVQEVSWCDTSKLLPQIPQSASLQWEPDTNGLASSIPDAGIPEEARTKLWELLDKKYPQIIWQTQWILVGPT